MNTVMRIVKQNSLIFLLLLVGCVHEPVAPGDPKNRVTIVLDQAPRSMDPRFTIDTTSMKVGKLMFSALVSVHNDALEPKPELAERTLGSNGELRRAAVRQG